MKKLKTVILSLMAICTMSLALVPAGVVSADIFDDACSGDNADTALCQERDGDKLGTIIGTIVNTLLYILGAVAVIVIIVAGVTFATSAGNTEAVTKAKSSILYAVVGLVVAMLAYAIVNFALDLF